MRGTDQQPTGFDLLIRVLQILTAERLFLNAYCICSLFFILPESVFIDATAPLSILGSVYVLSGDGGWLTRLEGRCKTEFASQWRKVSVPWGSASAHRWAVEKRKSWTESTLSETRTLSIRPELCVPYLPGRDELWSCRFLPGGKSPRRPASPPGLLEPVSRRCQGDETGRPDCREGYK